MYHYAHYREDDVDRLLPVIRAFPLALVVSCTRGNFLASHLPLIATRKPDGKLVLLGHLDANNPQASELDSAQVYIVFAGPNAYISPNVYVTRQLPTWNYIAVHATGRCALEKPGLKILDDIERLVTQVEPEAGGWALDKTEERVRKLAPLICRLSIEVDHVEGRFKLSQEKQGPDRCAATDHLLADNPSLRPLVEQLFRKRETNDELT